MPGNRFLGWHFKSRTPWWFTILLGLLLVDSALHFGLLFAVSWWASPSRDALHTYRLPFRDGNIYFVQQWMGAYLDARWVGAALLVLLIVMLVLNRKQLERG